MWPDPNRATEGERGEAPERDGAVEDEGADGPGRVAAAPEVSARVARGGDVRLGEGTGCDAREARRREGAGGRRGGNQGREGRPQARPPEDRRPSECHSGRTRLGLQRGSH